MAALLRRIVGRARRPLRAAIRGQLRLFGVEAVNARLLVQTRWVRETLVAAGGNIAEGGVLHGPLTIHNASPDYRNLTIGANVHLGREVFLDLTDRIEIRRDATVSMRAVILTHQDVGERPLAKHYPRAASPTIIGEGAYVGAGAVVLAGCNVGSKAVVGAGAVVTKPVPPGGVAVGVPARLTKGEHEPA